MNYGSFPNQLRSAIVLVALLAFVRNQIVWAGPAEPSLVPGQLPPTGNPHPGTLASANSVPDSQKAPAPAPVNEQENQKTTTVVTVPVPASGTTTLEITTLEGDDGVNIINKKRSARAEVQVKEDGHTPVEGAAVTFIAPADGPSVIFPNGLRTATVLTDAAGRARISGMRPVNAGTFKYEISASFHGQIANITLSQTNYETSKAAAAAEKPAPGEKPAPVDKPAVAKSSGISGKAVGVLVGVAAAAAVGIGVGLAGGHGSTAGSSSSTTTTASIGTGGAPVPGAPH